VVPPSFYYNLVYSLRYRAIDANAWALSCFLIQQAYGSPRETTEGHRTP